MVFKWHEKKAQIKSPQGYGIKPASYRPNLGQQPLLFHISIITGSNQSGNISCIWFVGKGR